MLAEKLHKTSGEGLAVFIKHIRSECSSAFEDLDADKIQITIDSIDRRTYIAAMQILDQYHKSTK